MNILIVINLLILLFIQVEFVINSAVGNFCIYKRTGAQGQCKHLINCQEAVHNLHVLHELPQQCGFEGSQPIVCCPITTTTTITNAEITPSAATTTKTTTTTTFKTTTTIEEIITTKKQANINKHQPGHKSRQKCREYSKYVYKKARPPILIEDVDETTQNECGFKIVELIVGGELAKRKEFPHMAIIGYEPIPGEIYWQCGGTIISEKFILTAGHCLSNIEVGDAKYIKTGVTNLNAKDHLQIITIIDRLKHPNYKPPSHYNDIGLLHLEKSITLNPYVRPACLYTNYQITTQKAIATGWGRTTFGGEGSDDLLKVTLDFFSVSNCNYSYRNHIGRRLKNGILDESQVCAGSFNDEKDTCQGDSGGPLQIFHGGDNIKCMYDIVGVTSFGKACGIGKSPGIYTRISYFTEWIENVVWP